MSVQGKSLHDPRVSYELELGEMILITAWADRAKTCKFLKSWNKYYNYVRMKYLRIAI